VDEQVVRVYLLFRLVEDDRRSRGRLFELVRIHFDAVCGAGATVAFGLERGPREDQREIDVEKDSFDHEDTPGACSGALAPGTLLRGCVGGGALRLFELFADQPRDRLR